MSEERHVPIVASKPGYPCKTEGALAADAGVLLADDPYLPGTPEFAQWMEGWCNRTAIRQLTDFPGA